MHALYYMVDTIRQAVVDSRGVSRRDFMKFCSLMIGGVALPRTFVSTIEQALAALELDPLIPQPYFQWQNEFLLSHILPGS